MKIVYTVALVQKVEGEWDERVINGKLFDSFPSVEEVENEINNYESDIENRYVDKGIYTVKTLYISNIK